MRQGCEQLLQGPSIITTIIIISVEIHARFVSLSHTCKHQFIRRAKWRQFHGQTRPRLGAISTGGDGCREQKDSTPRHVGSTPSSQSILDPCSTLTSPSIVNRRRRDDDDDDHGNDHWASTCPKVSRRASEIDAREGCHSAPNVIPARLAPLQAPRQQNVCRSRAKVNRTPAIPIRLALA